MKNYSKSVAVLAALWLVISTSATPVRRSPDLEARRRSAIDRSMIRFGRSYPPEPSAADIRDSFQRPTRRGNSFLRFGRSQPLTLTADDLYSLLRNYDDDNDKRSAAGFIRFGRDDRFVRLTRSNEDEKEYQQISEPFNGGYPQKMRRARDHFIRLGRDNEELEKSAFDEEENRRKRSTEACPECQS